ncbi:MAG: hypothetical protein JKY88_09020 [Pseudomonadales bacterium]|nr:hypothetical protein [Pseudomonadales bacterium]
MKAKVIHKECGGQIGWLSDYEERYLKSDLFMRMDGTHPEPGSSFREICPECGQIMVRVGDMEAGTSRAKLQP